MRINSILTPRGKQFSYLACHRSPNTLSFVAELKNVVSPALEHTECLNGTGAESFMLIWLLPPVNVKQTRPIKESSCTPLPHLPKKQYPRTKSYGSRRIFSGGWGSKIFYYDSFSQSKDLFSFFFSQILSPKVAVATAVKLKRRLAPTTPLQPLLPLFYKFECILGP